MIVKKAIKRSMRKKFPFKSMTGFVTAALFVLSINTSSTFAKTLSNVPILGKVVNVLTFTEYTLDEPTYKANLKVPAVTNLKNKDLEQSLNKKYLDENKELYDQFTKEIEYVKKETSGAHLGIDSGYEVKTDNEDILSIGRYVVNTAASSSTTMKFDTVDKKKEILLSLPILFKDKSYVKIISENIKEQMNEQMKKDENKVYWIPEANLDYSIDPFTSMKEDQNFYINKDHKLVISFDKYEIAPGYMGVVEFTIPTDILSNILVGHHYIR
ncbi:anti-sigma factor [Bacillus sp. AFS041924]|nr:anti-sigma factor [Bacillus sp. AFS041924]